MLLVVVRPDDAALARAAAAVDEHRARLLGRGQECRAAAFTSPAPAEDIVRLANREGVDLLLLPCEPELQETGLPLPTTASVLTGAACDIGLLASRPGSPSYDEVLVPFGGSTHDWAALELGAWAADAMGLPLTLLGSRGGSSDNGRDGSRLLADASLVVQTFVGVSAGFHLVEPGSEQVIQRAAPGSLLVVGLPERWRQDGIGTTRLELVRDAGASVLLVRKGVRPGGLAPRDSTVFAWSLTSVSSRNTRLARPQPS
jgi:hypothetical protein